MARGAFLNLFMAAMVLPFSEKGFAIASKPLEVTIALVAATLMLAVWWQYTYCMPRRNFFGGKQLQV